MKKCLVCIDVYIVREGDTLYSVAERYRVSPGLLMKVNRIRDPHDIKEGLKICIPGFPGDLPVSPDMGGGDEAGGTDNGAECKGTVYTIIDGDTLYMIAKKNRINLNALIDANPGIDPYNLRVGDKLCIPR